VQRISGVKALAVELDVTLAGDSKRLDADIARAAANALEWLSVIPKARVKAMVENGWVTLSGDVDWQYQRLAAAVAVRFIMGVRGVSDAIAIKPRVSMTALLSDIEATLVRNAKSAAQHISVRLDGAEITLSGSVANWAERELVRSSAWGTPGVKNVVDNLRIAQ